MRLDPQAVATSHGVNIFGQSCAFLSDCVIIHQGTGMDSDSVLLQRYSQTKDAQAFAQLVQRYAAMVFSVARRITGNVHDAEDVAQGCFMELAKAAGSIRS